MEVRNLITFLKIIETGSFSKAAEQLTYSQSTVTVQIQQLEEEIGVPLFEHRKGKIVLNDYGRCFLASVNLSLGELENGVRSIQRMYDAAQNILALGCSIDDLLPDVLRDFMPEHPEIGIRQFSGSPAELADRRAGRDLCPHRRSAPQHHHPHRPDAGGAL